MSRFPEIAENEEPASRPPDWCARHDQPARVFMIAQHWYVRCEDCEAAFLDWYGRGQYRGATLATEPRLPG